MSALRPRAAARKHHQPPATEATDWVSHVLRVMREEEGEIGGDQAGTRGIGIVHTVLLLIFSAFLAFCAFPTAAISYFRNDLRHTSSQKRSQLKHQGQQVVLVTGGQRVAALRLVRVLAHAGHRVVVAGHEYGAFSVVQWSNATSKVYKLCCQPFDVDCNTQRLIHIIAAENADLWIPCSPHTDPFFLAEVKATIEKQTSCKALYPDNATLERLLGSDFLGETFPELRPKPAVVESRHQIHQLLASSPRGKRYSLREAPFRRRKSVHWETNGDGVPSPPETPTPIQTRSASWQVSVSSSPTQSKTDSLIESVSIDGNDLSPNGIVVPKKRTPSLASTSSSVSDSPSLPLRTMSETYNYLAELKVSREQPWVVEEEVEEGELFTARCFVAENDVHGFGAFGDGNVGGHEGKSRSRRAESRIVEPSSTVHAISHRCAQKIAARLPSDCRTFLTIEFTVGEHVTDHGTELRILPTSILTLPLATALSTTQYEDIVAILNDRSHDGSDSLPSSLPLCQGTYSLPPLVLLHVYLPIYNLLTLRGSTTEIIRGCAIILDRLLYWEEELWCAADPWPWFLKWCIRFPGFLIWDAVRG
ncbi:hypothetical protein LTS18_000574 [Coniosporium uncinatum]|uniref:Uncharacterized protein n=1 Tax=Coniosporium uncinatum TaxID=93489 RepID=A0ACC3DC43_9PEZI|nr:hypothetical protein LTS18_000574 [Coniosporium uncinatum]